MESKNVGVEMPNDDTASPERVPLVKRWAHDRKSKKVDPIPIEMTTDAEMATGGKDKKSAEPKISCKCFS